MFRFRLEKVLRHRQRRVEAEARELRLRTAACAAARRQREQVEAEISAISELGARQRTDGRSLLQWRLLGDYLGRLQARRLVLVAREREAASAQTAQREQLLRAHRAQEVLTRLRERQRMQWEDEERHRQQRQLDEVAARGHWDG